MVDSEYFLKRVSTGKDIPLAPVTSVGRSDDSAVRLAEGRPSRNHAQITLDQGHVFIEDLGSVNGTFVNGRRLDPKVKFKLTAGDRVRFDLEEFLFVDAKPTDTDKTVFRPPDPDKTVFRSPEPKPRGGDVTQRLAVEALPPGNSGAASPRAESEKSLSAVKPAPADKVEKALDAPASSAPKPRAVDKPASADPAAAENKALPGAFAEPPPDATIFVGSQKKQNQPGSAAPAPAHAAGDPPYLWIDSGQDAGKKVELKGELNKTWRVGSSENSSIRFEDPGVSGKHATLHENDKRWLLTDDLSVNGTFVNDKKILRSYLANGDRLRFGPVECRFYLPPPRADERAAGRALWRRYGLIAALAFVLTLALLFAVHIFTR